MTETQKNAGAALLKLTPDQRTSLSKLMVLLDEFRKIDPEMPLQQAITLVTVALNPGLTVSEIARTAGLTLSSTSRHVAVLGPWREAKKQGKELLADDYGDLDRRSKVINLTAAGGRVIKTLIHLISH